ncbi:MAG: hypothetical protein CV087_24190 [Candidatus Brocadia sp. WS118]|nr:MAG: hypothetical protein CV087_24190 [Candidatus Brocadia sp. WS118]
MRNVIIYNIYTAFIVLLFSVFSCTPVLKEDLSPEQSLEKFITRKYGVNPDTLKSATYLNFNRRIYIPELELEFVLPMMGEAGFEPCLILFDKENTRFYNKCDGSVKYNFSAIYLENRVKQYLLEKEQKPEYLALPDSMYYKIKEEHPIGVVEDYLNDAFVDTLISEALFFQILDAYFKEISFARVELKREETILQASTILHNYIQESTSGEFPCSQECIEYAVYELNRLRDPIENEEGTYRAIYQSKNVATKLVSIKLDIGKLASTGPPYFNSINKFYYSLEVNRILLAPIFPSILW